MLKQPVLLSERLTKGANTRKKKQIDILLGVFWGDYMAIANKYEITPIWVWRLSWSDYQEMLDDPSDDDDNDDSGDYDSDRTF